MCPCSADEGSKNIISAHRYPESVALIKVAHLQSITYYVFRTNNGSIMVPSCSNKCVVLVEVNTFSYVAWRFTLCDPILLSIHNGSNGKNLVNRQHHR